MNSCDFQCIHVLLFYFSGDLLQRGTPLLHERKVHERHIKETPFLLTLLAAADSEMPEVAEEVLADLHSWR